MFELSEYEKLETTFFTTLHAKLDQILIGHGMYNKFLREMVCKEAIEAVGSHLDENAVDVVFIKDGIKHKYSEGYMMRHHDNAAEAVIDIELPDAEDPGVSLYEIHKNRHSSRADTNAL